MRVVFSELILVLASACLLSLLPQRDDGVLMSFWGALLGLGGSLLGGLLGNRKSREEKDALAAQTNLQRTQTGALQSGINAAQNTVLPRAGGFLDLFQNALNPVQSYFSRLLSGDRTAMMEELGPEIASTGEAYDQARRTAAMSLPRGGGRVAATGDLLSDRTRQISNLFSTVRPMAAQGLTNVGSLYGQMGQGLTGQGLFALTNAGFGAGQTGANLLNYGQSNRAMGFEQGGQIGRGLFDLIQQIQNRGRKTGNV